MIGANTNTNTHVVVLGELLVEGALETPSLSGSRLASEPAYTGEPAGIPGNADHGLQTA